MGEIYKPNVLNENLNDLWQDYKYWWETQKLRPWVEVIKDIEYCFATFTWDYWLVNSVSTIMPLNIFETNLLSTTNNRINIGKPWIYNIIAWVTFDTSNVWQRQVMLRKNWVNILNSWSVSNSYIESIHNMSTLEKLNSWDYLDLVCFQQSWSTLNIIWWYNKSFLKIINII